MVALARKQGARHHKGLWRCSGKDTICPRVEVKTTTFHTWNKLSQVVRFEPKRCVRHRQPSRADPCGGSAGTLLMSGRYWSTLETEEHVLWTWEIGQYQLASFRLPWYKGSSLWGETHPASFFMEYALTGLFWQVPGCSGLPDKICDNGPTATKPITWL